MNTDFFWNVIEQCKNYGRPEFKLKQILEQLPATEVKEFMHHFEAFETKLCRFEIHRAAHLLNGGCSDSDFAEFRYGLIAKGRTAYESVLTNPDYLHSLWEHARINNDATAYVALAVYAEKLKISWDEAGDEIYDSSYEPDRDIYVNGLIFDKPLVDSWSLDDEKTNRKWLPRLSQLYYESLYSKFDQWLKNRAIIS